MTWIYLILVFFLTDILLYARHWKNFARRYYFVDYGISYGWMMAWKLRRK